ncbi:hypothetical protein LAZ67_4001256 [Cordylochernes scorpioides]|uniref:Vitellogenin n=1 Tax=Cordylochernes scorpioides TaxID=51811 RepID=A0ABY6KBT0_9ARAC|nr:hypothetical protein LAZ67_4001256 [Cordylochernes scorpioides]
MNIVFYRNGVDYTRRKLRKYLQQDDNLPKTRSKLRKLLSSILTSKKNVEKIFMEEDELFIVLLEKMDSLEDESKSYIIKIFVKLMDSENFKKYVAESSRILEILTYSELDSPYGPLLLNYASNDLLANSEKFIELFDYVRLSKDPIMAQKIFRKVCNLLEKAPKRLLKKNSLHLRQTFMWLLANESPCKAQALEFIGRQMPRAVSIAFILPLVREALPLFYRLVYHDSVELRCPAYRIIITLEEMAKHIPSINQVLSFYRPAVNLMEMYVTPINISQGFEEIFLEKGMQKILMMYKFGLLLDFVTFWDKKGLPRNMGR